MSSLSLSPFFCWEKQCCRMLIDTRQTEATQRTVSFQRKRLTKMKMRSSPVTILKNPSFWHLRKCRRVWECCLFSGSWERRNKRRSCFHPCIYFIQELKRSRKKALLLLHPAQEKVKNWASADFSQALKHPYPPAERFFLQPECFGIWADGILFYTMYNVQSV